MPKFAWWPKLSPVVPPWTAARVEALRIVVRAYVTITRSHKKIILAAKLGKSDIDNFTKKGKGLGGGVIEREQAEPSDTTKLDALYEYAFRVLEEDQANPSLNAIKAARYQALEPQLQLLYQPRQRQFQGLLNSIAEQWPVLEPDEGSLLHRAGVYHLYRHADDVPATRGGAIIRVAVSIIAAPPLLQFKMTYVPKRGVDKQASVNGIVLPCRHGFALFGRDQGAGKNPCVYFFKADPTAPADTYLGSMMRINTDDKVVSARVLMHRLRPPTTDAGDQSLKPPPPLNLYALATAGVGKLILEAAADKAQLDALREGPNAIRDFDAHLNNFVDNAQRYVLYGENWPDPDPVTIVPDAEPDPSLTGRGARLEAQAKSQRTLATERKKGAKANRKPT